MTDNVAYAHPTQCFKAPGIAVTKLSAATAQPATAERPTLKDTEAEVAPGDSAAAVMAAEESVFPMPCYCYDILVVPAVEHGSSALNINRYTEMWHNRLGEPLIMRKRIECLPDPT